MFIGKTGAKAEAPMLWPLDVKNWLIWKDPDAGKNWRQEDKGMTEDEMVGWHHWLNGRESEQVPGAGDGQGNLACYSPWGCKELDMTEQLSWTDSESQMERKKSKRERETEREEGRKRGKEKEKFGDFAGSPVVKTPHFHARDHEFNFWWETKILHVVWCSQIKKKKKKKKDKSVYPNLISHYFHLHSNPIKMSKSHMYANLHLLLHFYAYSVGSVKTHLESCFQ